MIFDTDDLHETNHRLDLLQQLKDANPEFKMTAFAVPAYCPDEFLEELPDWIEVAAHGFHHGGRDCNDPFEAAHWTYEETRTVLDRLHPRFVKLWKSPGWQISDGTYLALVDYGWAVADHPNNSLRRPAELKAHVAGGPDHVHTHVQNVCGNGLEETFGSLLELVRNATEFQFVSEAVT